MCFKMVHVVTYVFVILAALNLCVAFNTSELPFEELRPREVRQSNAADCTMGSDRGPCRNYTVKWFYDIPVGCTRFWYGGCGGNGNKYESKEECEGVCVEPPGKARCNLAKDVGPCEGRYPIWYYDNSRNQCAQFVYGGCLGNNNRFESYEECSLLCAKDSNNNATDAVTNVEKCANYCANLRCRYGVEVYNDTDPLYKKCYCHGPCKQVICDEGNQCAADLKLNRTSANNATFVAVCRGSKAGAKPGECPEIKRGNFLPDCHKECRNDADCALDLICCSNGCSRACLKPGSTIKVQQLVTATGYYSLQATSPLHEAFYPPQLIEEEFEPELFAGEGDYITLICPVKGNPKPTITWSKENIFIGGSEARFRVLDAALQIVPLHKTDSGIYHCTADNKIGQPIKKKITLEVLDSVDHPSRILNAEVSRNMMVSLGSKTILDCFAYGYPIPVTTWWKGDRLLPLKTSELAVSKDNALLIYAVKPHNLGLYTCQAYNGYGKVATWSVMVQALGMLNSTNDNDTAARGHNYNDCGCQDSHYGCCPDNYTAATGEDYNGCLCHTFQFGCCPDGVTVAKGPHKRGCDCRNTEFGCCSDNKLPAKGPNLEGCGCASTKYGCCLDETMEAKGEHFEGCTENPGNLQADCTLDLDKGTCKDYTLKWFYDTADASCSSFWYGGCGGNRNKYNSKKECENVCVEPQGKARCNLAKLEGPCNEYYPKWYYDHTHNQCAQFRYGGCLGNNNRFEVYNECSLLCIKDSNIGTCSLPKVVGPCNGEYEQWYYDATTDLCEIFTYGGCLGNENRFEDKYSCEKLCKRGTISDTETPEGFTKQTDISICDKTIDAGNCSGNIPAYYYDSVRQECSMFIYTGCGGNANRYNSEEECERQCGKFRGQVPATAIITLLDTTFRFGSDISIPCKVDGYPTPSVQWYKDGKQIHQSQSIQVSDTHTLIMKNTKHSDSGEYSCEAFNTHSKAISSTSLRILYSEMVDPNCTDNQFFANCKLIVQAKYCSSKYYAKFCCHSCTKAGLLPR